MVGEKQSADWQSEQQAESSRDSATLGTPLRIAAEASAGVAAHGTVTVVSSPQSGSQLPWLTRGGTERTTHTKKSLRLRHKPAIGVGVGEGGGGSCMVCSWSLSRGSFSRLNRVAAPARSDLHSDFSHLTIVFVLVALALTQQQLSLGL